MGARVIAVWVVLALALAGPLQPLAMAQQPGRMPPEPAQPPAQTQQPEADKEAVNVPEVPAEKPRKTDAYDVGAGAMTVVGFPLKATTCVLGGALAVALFVATFGSADRATAGVVREGCVQKWIVRGDDIRPPRPTVQADRAWDPYDGAVR